jgi:mono/diheme cytochrome c family protein
MGGGNGMMERHHATIPADYADVTNPTPDDSDSLARGASLYATHCASCHGDGGMGDGAAGAALDPKPASVAHTSQMMSDAYLFWRVSEGGVPFQTAMPVWKDLLDEQARWDVINYVRALGAGTVAPAQGSGGEAYDPAADAARQAEILAQAVEQKVITQEEADLFALVHNAVDDYRAAHPEVTNEYPDATARENAILSALVEAGTITQAQADAFNDIHDRLGAAGLMQ